MQLVRAHQTQQQRARHNEIERFLRRSASVILERAAFHKSVTIGEMTIICKYCKALKYSGESIGRAVFKGWFGRPIAPPGIYQGDAKMFTETIKKF